MVLKVGTCGARGGLRKLVGQEFRQDYMILLYSIKFVLEFLSLLYFTRFLKIVLDFF
jgi:hypothetical protein